MLERAARPERQEPVTGTRPAVEAALRPPQTARQRAILGLIGAQGFVSVAQIASRFGVAEMTVRRDLKALEHEGGLKRTHGGAIPVEAPAEEREPPFDWRQKLNGEAKRRIARAAALLVAPGDVIGIDVGTTTLAFARCLVGRRELRVFTNSLRAAMTLADGGVPVYTPGGEVRPLEMSLTGSIALGQLAQYRLDRVFLGISGLTRDGIFDYSPEDSEVKRLFIRQAQEVVVLADASKLDRWSTVRIAELSDLDVLVTDRAPSADIAAALDGAGVRVVVAGEDTA